MSLGFFTIIASLAIPAYLAGDFGVVDRYDDCRYQSGGAQHREQRSHAGH